jgi:hypothetical protein
MSFHWLYPRLSREVLPDWGHGLPIITISSAAKEPMETFIDTVARVLRMSSALFSRVTSLLKKIPDSRAVSPGVIDDPERSCCSQALGVLKEHNIPLILNKPALVHDSIHFCPSDRPALKVHTRCGETLLRGCRGLPVVHHSITHP